jgi:hypothetical protein
MFLCQWSIEIIFGKQKDALEIINDWGKEKMKSSRFSKSTGGRVYVGYIGDSPSLIIDEYVFNNLDDFEKALSDMSKPQFKKYAEKIAKVIIAGSQKWKVFKIISK